MEKLLEIARDYRNIKNYVYQRYGGIRGLPKIYPGYTVQNEMTQSGLRAESGLPAVYFYLGIFDALKDIKSQWAQTKNAVLAAINANEKFTETDRHYLRFVIKVDSCFQNILNEKDISVPNEMQQQYERITKGKDSESLVDTERLNRYLCRQVRKKLRKLHTDKMDGFAITERAYRYGMSEGKHGIFISTKEKRKRIFVPLTDQNEYKRQLYIRLIPKKNRIEIAVPMEVKIKTHPDYENEIGISIGMWHMFTTDKGQVYGGKIGELNKELADFLTASDKTYRREKENNPGRMKYKAQHRRLSARLESYINQEINRMIKTEKPKIIFMPKLPQSSGKAVNGKISYYMTIWRKGYIRRRLEEKCRENNIAIVEVIGKDISVECSICGSQGEYRKDIFVCGCCGYKEDKKVNAARNAIKRGNSGQRLNIVYVSNDNRS